MADVDAAENTVNRFLQALVSVVVEGAHINIALKFSTLVKLMLKNRLVWLPLTLVATATAAVCNSHEDLRTWLGENISQPEFVTVLGNGIFYLVSAKYQVWMQRNERFFFMYHRIAAHYTTLFVTSKQYGFNIHPSIARRVVIYVFQTTVQKDYNDATQERVDTATQQWYKTNDDRKNETFNNKEILEAIDTSNTTLFKKAHRGEFKMLDVEKRTDLLLTLQTAVYKELARDAVWVDGYRKEKGATPNGFAYEIRASDMRRAAEQLFEAIFELDAVARFKFPWAFSFLVYAIAYVFVIMIVAGVIVPTAEWNGVWISSVVGFMVGTLLVIGVANMNPIFATREITSQNKVLKTLAAKIIEGMTEEKNDNRSVDTSCGNRILEAHPTIQKSATASIQTLYVPLPTIPPR